MPPRVKGAGKFVRIWQKCCRYRVKSTRCAANQRQVNNNLLQRGFRLVRPAFVTAIVFSFFINLLVFVSPLYMLQIYDRVITSRNVYTLLMLTLIAAFLIVVYAVLEKVRSAVLVRAGLLFDTEVRSELFEKVLRGSLKQPGIAHHTVLRELDTVREFLTGGGLISFCDVPWVPIFVAGCFICIHGRLGCFGGGHSDFHLRLRQRIANP